MRAPKWFLGLVDPHLRVEWVALTARRKHLDLRAQRLAEREIDVETEVSRVRRSLECVNAENERRVIELEDQVVQLTKALALETQKLRAAEAATQDALAQLVGQ